MATAISSLPNEVTKNQVVSRVEQNTEAAVNYIDNDNEFQTLIDQSKHKKVEQDRLDVLYDELQTPVIVMILFFFFQLPIFQKTLAKNIPSLFSRDGNPSFSGYLFKTSAFGLVFYGLTKLTKQISEI